MVVGVPVGSSPVVGVFVGVGVGMTYTISPNSQLFESIILTKKLLSAIGDGTVNEYGKVVALPT